MASEMDLRSTAVGAGIAGFVSVVVMVALTTATVGPPALRAIVAILLGVTVAQVYQHRVS